MDHPGVRCENCKNIERVDRIAPPCRAPLISDLKGSNQTGCPIPPLSPEAARLLEMRGMLASLKGLADAGTVLKMCGATLEDLKMLATLEDEVSSRIVKERR